jgi:hypothetical protein
MRCPTAGEVLDATFFEWLTDVSDASANALWHVLSTARAHDASGRTPCTDAGDVQATEVG